MEKRTLDSYEVRGKQLARFKTELEEIAKITTQETIKAKDITILSKCTDKKDYNVYLIRPRKRFNFAEGIPSVNLAEVDGSKISSAPRMLTEFRRNTKTLLQFGNKKKMYFCSDNLWTTLSARSGVGGPQMSIPSLERDLLIAKGLNKDDYVKAIIRTEDGQSKIFAIMSDRYKYEPNTCLAKIVEEIDDGTLGKMKINNWFINQSIAEIYIEFPDKAKELAKTYEFEDEFIPGVYLAKSDIGECAVKAKATWRTGNSIFVDYEIRRRNTKNLDIDKIISDIKANMFKKYTKLPETLCDLMMIDITDPSLKTSGMSMEDIKKKSRQAVVECLQYAFKIIKMEEAIGKTRSNAIFEQIIDSLDYSLDYTAYDIAMQIMTLPGSLAGIPRTALHALQEACGRAPYIDYGDFAEEAILLA